MVVPNFNLFLWIILIAVLINSIAKIFLGLAEAEKSQNYGVVDVLDGIVWLIVIIITLLT